MRYARAGPSLEMEVAADRGCAWRLEVYANNTHLLGRVIAGGEKPGQRNWQKLTVDLAVFAGQEVALRIYQRTLLPEGVGGNAYWRNLRIR
jgi:hypothetical protein